MSDIKEFNLIDVRNNSSIVNDLNNVYKLWGYEEISPSFINDLETIKGREVIDGDELIGIVSNSSLCLRPEMTTSIVKLTSTRLLNKKRPIRLFNSGIVFNKKQSYKNTYKFQENLQSGIELISYDTQYPEIEVINILFDAIDNINLKDIIKSMMPGVSVIGCPKIRTIQLLNSQEKEGRNIFTGSFGFIKFNMDMRFNIIIRSILNFKNTSEISAASGVVLDSFSKKEFNENYIKAKSLLELFK